MGTRKARNLQSDLSMDPTISLEEFGRRLDEADENAKKPIKISLEAVNQIDQMVKEMSILEAKKKELAEKIAGAVKSFFED